MADDGLLGDDHKEEDDGEMEARRVVMGCGPHDFGFV